MQDLKHGSWRLDFYSTQQGLTTGTSRRQNWHQAQTHHLDSLYGVIST